MTSHIRRVVPAVALALALASAVPAPAFAQPVPPLTVPVVSNPATAPAGTSFAGTLSITRFISRNGQVFAIGNVSGLLTTADGVTSVVNAVAVPIDPATTATCQILNLVLGPLHVNLLGLVVDLNQVVLNITGQTGAGNLLGNLLCGITGILDRPALLARLLNDLLGALL